MKKNILLPAMMLAVAFASCNNDDDANFGDSRVALGVNVALEEMGGSRAMVKGNYLAAGSEIGVCVVANANGGDYDGHTTGYINVPYKATGTEDPDTDTKEQSWGASNVANQILLSGTEGKAYAYYPYQSASDFDYTAIDVDVTEQTDWMWSGPEGPLTDAASSVGFTLKHAQTAVNVVVVRDESYTGTGEISALTVTSDGLGSTGVLNAQTGEFTGVAGQGDAISIIGGAFTVTKDDAGTVDVNEAKKENPYMLIPASAEVKNFTITATVDTKLYNVGVTMTEAFTPGKVYKINVKITNVGLVIDSVVIVDEWQEDNTLPEGELKPQA